MFLAAFVLSLGRCERIRTFDPLHPMQVRYQAAPHTDLGRNYSRGQRNNSVRQREEIANLEQFAPQIQQAL